VAISASSLFADLVEQEIHEEGEAMVGEALLSDMGLGFNEPEDDTLRARLAWI
jgi:hypothetical protein